jgi:hypothetical protein
MKLSKKAMTVLSFAVGACVFVTTAFADMALGSGYDQLKATAKHTAAQMEKGLNSYTVEALMTLKNKDEIAFQVSTVQRFDTDKSMADSTMTDNSNGKTTSHYEYSDRELSIWKNDSDETYYVSERLVQGQEHQSFRSPFQEEGAEEIEKIFDAIVGNLKDYVHVEENSEGGRSYSGSLSEVQVPALVNAVTSFGIKQMIHDQSRNVENSKLPELKSDIYVKKVIGTATESSKGLLEQLTGEVIVSGKDAAGVPHELSLSAVVQLSNVNSTTVEKPDLEGKKVEKMVHTNGFGSKYVGEYKNNIIIEKDGQFVKIGERTLEISSVDNDKVTGTFVESVKPEYASEYTDLYHFTFAFDPDQSKSMSFFTYTNAKGEEEKGQLHVSGFGKIYVDLGIDITGEHSYQSNVKPNFDGEFYRVFEE